MDALRRALFLALLPLAAHATITRVGHAAHFDVSQNNTVTVSYAPTTGNLVVVGCTSWINASTTPTTAAASDGGTNTYTLATSKFNGSKVTAYLYYSLNVTGGSFTYSCAFTGASFWANIYVVEYSGVATSSATDGSATSSSSVTGSPVITAGQTTTNAADVIVGIWAVGDGNGTITSTPGGGFSALDESLNINASVGGGSMERIVSSTGTYTASTVRSPTGTEPFAMVQAAFKATGSGSTTKVSASVQ